ncbi:MAG: hypothetical protein E7491_06080 [Ruminococcaceae bacterium]|nr:hypothetical protein [Oscillospiraceae bacterium]
MEQEQVFDKRRLWVRCLIVGVLFAVIIVFFSGKLVSAQLSPEALAASAEKYTYTEVPIKAVRGEIYSSNGTPLVVNKSSYSLILNRAYMPNGKAEQTQILLRLLNIMEENGCTYTDSLPISSNPPFTYTIGQNGSEVELNRLARLCKNFLQISENATADEAFEALCKRYALDISTVSEDTARRLVGLRYDMEQANFSAKNPFTVVKNIDSDTATRIMEHSFELAGVEISTVTTREYAVSGVASHLLGRVTSIYPEETEKYTALGYSLDAQVGRDGVEKAFEHILRPTDGVKIVVKNSKGEVVNEFIEKEAVAGNDVFLTLDLDLQYVAEQSLAKTIQSISANAVATGGEGADADSGACVVLDVKSGSLLASASYPTFDLTTFYKDYNDLLANESKPLFNRAISGTYAPGSTFKMATAIAGLSADTISTSTKLRCDGIYHYYDTDFYCWYYSDHHRTHGSINLQDALRVSCNCYFYQVGEKTGIDAMNEVCRKLGLGEYTGIELSAERKGVLAGRDFAKSQQMKWEGGDALQAAIGQSYNAFTPLQLANMTATIVNGGTRYSVHLLDSIRTYQTGETVFVQEPVVLDKVDLSEKELSTILNGLRDVTETGTASKVFKNYEVPVGGKTGTASVSSGTANGVFIAFAPFDDPEIAVAIVVEHGAHGNYVAEVAKDIFDEYFIGRGYFDESDIGSILIN